MITNRAKAYRDLLDAYRKRRPSSRPGWALTAIKEIRSILSFRWGRNVPALDDPDTRFHLRCLADVAVAHHAQPVAGSSVSMTTAAAGIAGEPIDEAFDCEAEIIRRVASLVSLVTTDKDIDPEALARIALNSRRKWTSSTLSEALEITVEEHAFLRLSLLRPASHADDEAWRAFRRARERERGRRRREEANATPRSEIEKRAASVRSEIADFIQKTGKSERSYWRMKRKSFEESERVSNASGPYSRSMPGRATDTSEIGRTAISISERRWITKLRREPARADAVARLFDIASQMLVKPRSEAA